MHVVTKPQSIDMLLVAGLLIVSQALPMSVPSPDRIVSRDIWNDHRTTIGVSCNENSPKNSHDQNEGELQGSDPSALEESPTSDGYIDMQGQQVINMNKHFISSVVERHQRRVKHQMEVRKAQTVQHDKNRTDSKQLAGTKPRQLRLLNNEYVDTILQLIELYFSYRNLRELHVFACSEADAVLLLRNLVKTDFKVNVKSFIDDEVSGRLSDTLLCYFVDITCEKNRQKLSKAWRNGGTWLVYEDEGMHVADSDLKQLRLDSDVVLASPDGVLTSVYVKYGQVFKEEAGSWRPSNPKLPDKKGGRFDLMGHQLSTAIVKSNIKLHEEFKTKEMLDPNYAPGEETQERCSYKLFQELAFTFNFTVKHVTTDTWGLLQENGSFTGIIGLLIGKKVDFGIAPMEMREERFYKVKFLPHMLSIRFIFLFIEERTLGTYKALYIPFSSTVWLCTVSMILVSGIIFGIMFHGEIFHGIVFIIGILAQQGLAMNPNEGPARLYSACLLLLGLILYTYYNAAIMNGLLSPSPITIHNAQELKKSPLKIVIANTPYLNLTYNQKKYIPTDILQRIQQDPNWWIERISGLEKMRHERLCLTGDDHFFYPNIENHFTDSEKCSLRELELLRPFPLAITMQEDTPYREMFYQGVIRLLESGVADRQRRTWLPRKPPCLGSTVFTHVSLEAVSMALAFYLLGIIGSCLIFSIELWIHSKKNCSKAN